MKKFTLVATIFLVAALAAAGGGCGSGGRDVSTPREALLGHWRNTVPGTNGEIYYSSDTATFKSAAGGAVSRPYKVTGENQSRFTLEIEYQANGAGPATIGFSTDRNELLVYPERVPEILKYSYVDSAQEP